MKVNKDLLLAAAAVCEREGLYLRPLGRQIDVKYRRGPVELGTVSLLLSGGKVVGVGASKEMAAKIANKVENELLKVAEKNPLSGTDIKGRAT